MNIRDLAEAEFRKATGSGDVGCVEVALTGNAVGVRDSKAQGRGPVLGFTPHEWRIFVQGIKDGEFDYPA